MVRPQSAGRARRLCSAAALGIGAALALPAAPAPAVAQQHAHPSELLVEVEDKLRRPLVEMLAAAGVDVNIKGGFGTSPDDPIIVLDSEPKAAAATRVNVLNSIHRIMGVYWREREDLLPGEVAGGFRFDQVRLTDGRRSDEPGALYFDVSRADPASRGLPQPETHLVDGWGMPPHEIGWVHYETVIDFESERSGMGWGLQYGGARMLLTLYVYRGVTAKHPPEIAAALVREEFSAAVEEVFETYPSEVEKLGPERLEAGFRRQDLRVSNRFWSVVGLTVDKGFYVKYRLSCADDPASIALAEETIAAIAAVLAD